MASTTLLEVPEMEEIDSMSSEELIKLYETISNAVNATEKTIDGVLEKAESKSPDMDFTNGLSLLNLRPHLLLTSLHHLLLLLSFRLSNPSTSSSSTSDTATLLPQNTFSNPNPPPRSPIPSSTNAIQSIRTELLVARETLEKVKGMEGKVAYQVGKLVGLAESEERRMREGKGKAAGGKDKVGDDEEEEQDLLSFKPNPTALLSVKAEKKQPKFVPPTNSTSSKRRGSVSDEDKQDEDDNDNAGREGLYRPPRVAAMPYVDGGRGKSGRKERRAPALLSEFASSLTSAPQLESTSGLSVRPVSTSTGAFHSNSTSANRLAELQRMADFEEENMTRLVMTKRESKRREEDEAALAMGYGVGGGSKSRSRRQGGFEAELEGVLGDRGSSKGMWDGVGKSLGKGDGGLLGRSRKRGSEAMLGGSGANPEDAGANGRPGKKVKGKFDKALKRNKQRS